MSGFVTKFLKICLFLTTILFLSDFVDSRKDKIKLKDLQVLTLKPNQWTTYRRTQPVPQLKCLSGYCDAIKGETVQCYNRGSDGLDIQWECKANINTGYKFGSLDVFCEGYDYPEDDYVLIGSCGLEYSIQPADQKQSFFGNDNTYTPIKTKPSNGFSIGFIITLCVIGFIIYYTCLRANGVTTDTNNPRTGTPGAPPPGFRSDFFDSSEGCSSSAGYSSGFTGFTDNTRHRNNNTGGGGFFTGLLTGGTLGYLFGSRNDTNYRNQSSYFGNRADPPSYFSTPSSSTSSSSPKTTTSGFAGTKRR